MSKIVFENDDCCNFTKQISYFSAKLLSQYTIDEGTHNMIKIPYDADRAAQLSGFLSDGIRSKLRNLNFSNYKYFVQVVIGEKKDQSVHIATRHFFDEMVDTWGSASFQSDTLYCTTVAYGIFQNSSSSSNNDHQIGIESEPMDSSLHL